MFSYKAGATFYTNPNPFMLFLCYLKLTYIEFFLLDFSHQIIKTNKCKNSKDPLSYRLKYLYKIKLFIDCLSQGLINKNERLDESAIQRVKASFLSLSRYFSKK